MALAPLPFSAQIGIINSDGKKRTAFLVLLGGVEGL